MTRLMFKNCTNP